MSHQEAKYSASFLTTLITSVIYAVRVRALWDSGYFDGADGMVLTGRAILIFIAAIVVAGILGQIVLAILIAILGQDFESAEDERDHQIELRALKLAFNLFGVGLLGALVALATGSPVFLVLHYIIYAMVLCGLSADLYRVWLHRRGF